MESPKQKEPPRSEGKVLCFGAFYSAIFWDNTKERQGGEGRWIKRCLGSKDLLIRCLKVLGLGARDKLDYLAAAGSSLG